MWCNRLSHCLGHPASHIRVQVPGTLLPIQLHANIPGKVAHDDPSVWYPVIHAGDLYRVPGSWLQVVLVLTLVASEGRHQPSHYNQSFFLCVLFLDASVLYFKKQVHCKDPLFPWALVLSILPRLNKCEPIITPPSSHQGKFLELQADSNDNLWHFHFH